MISNGKSAALFASAFLAIVLSAAPAWGSTLEPPNPDVFGISSESVMAGSTPEPVGVSIASGDNMRTLQAGGEVCSDGEGSDSIICVSLGLDDSGSQLPEHGTDFSTRATIPVPAWCLDQGVANQYFITRNAECGIFAGVLTVRQLVNGAPTGPITGTMNFLMYHYIYSLVDNTTWGNQMIVSPTIITGTAAGTQISGTASCTGSCTLQSQSFPVQVPGVHQNANGESYYKWNGTAGQVGTGTPRWSVNFKSPSAPNTSSLSQEAGVGVRCDNALPGAGAGCVIAEVTPWIRYDGTSFVEFGAHVASAQASGLPGARGGLPLHRTTNAAIRDTNRAKACPGNFPRPANRDCDEYPFASTLEGAASGGGSARVLLPWCQITLPQPPSTGPVGYSVCMIDRNENQQAGSLLNSVLYVPYRVIDGDAFNVDIIQ